MLEKRQYVRHPDEQVYKQWGVGIVIDGEKNGKVSVFFENTASQKMLSTSLVSLKVVDDPGSSRQFLDHAIYEDSRDKLPFPMVVENFLMRFQGGLKGDLYIKNEREYKVLASSKAKNLLGKEDLEGLLDGKNFVEVADRIKKVFSSTNLLASFESIKLNDALKSASGQQRCAEAFYELLYGNGDMASRIETAAKDFEEFELAKWPIVTYLPFLVFPESEMFVKPMMTKQAAERRRFDIQYDNHVNANTYRQIIRFAEDLKERLLADERSELHPIDMIDVQGFMWCTYADGWTDKDIREAMAKLN